MSFSYESPGDSSVGDLRMIVGDTVAAGHLLEDEEILHLMQMYGTWQAAVVPAVDVMIGKAGLRVTRSSAGESVDWSKLAANLRVRRAELVAAGYVDSAPTSSMSRVRQFRRPSSTVTEFS